MKTAKKQLFELKAWWAQCPSKDIAAGLGLLLGALVSISVWELGQLFGSWLYGVIF